MALQTQLVSIAFNQGADTKRDPLLVPTSKLLRLENGILGPKGTIEKRGGYRRIGAGLPEGLGAALAADASEGETISLAGRTATGLHAYGGELLLDLGGQLFSYVPSLPNGGALIERRSMSAMPTVRSERVIRHEASDASVESSDCASHGGFTVFAAVAREDSLLGGFAVLVSVKDERTGSFLTQNRIITSGSTSFINNGALGVRIAVLGERAWILLSTSSEIHAYHIDLAIAPHSIVASGVLFTGTDFDVCVSHDGTALWLAYASVGDSASRTVHIRRVNPSTMQLGSPVQLTVAGGATTQFQGSIHIAAAGSGAQQYLHVAWGSFGALRAATIHVSGESLTGTVAQSIPVESASAVRTIVGFPSPTQPNGFVYVFELAPLINNARGARIHSVLVSAGTNSVASSPCEKMGIASRCFQHNGRAYFIGIYRCSYATASPPLPSQATYFLIDCETMRRVARAETNNGAFTKDGVTFRRYVPHVASVGNGRYTAGVAVFDSALEVAGFGEVVTKFVLSQVTFDFDANRSSIEGDALFVAGGLPVIYDGSRAVEHGFSHPSYPDQIFLSAVPGSALSEGAYSYRFLYSWTGPDGRVHRSEPSLPHAVQVAGTGRVYITARAITTDKPKTELLIFRTEANGSIYYRCRGADEPPRFIDWDSTEAPSTAVVFFDEVPDSALITNEVLYTEGGELAAQPAPPCRFGCQHQNRLFLGGLEKPNRVVFSKAYREGFAPEFNEALAIDTGNIGGNDTALASMDDKLIIFKERAILAVIGEPPNDLGQQWNYSEPQQVASDIGCIDWRSVAQTQDGLFFKSTRGIFLLTRGLQTVYVGAAVEAYNGNTVTGAVVLSDTEQVRFYTAEGQCLVYNFQVRDEAGLGQWSVLTNHAAIGAVLHDGQPVHVRADGALLRHTPDAYTDTDGVTSLGIAMTVETAWLKLASLSGFQRVRRAALLGTYRGPTMLRLTAVYDYADDFEDAAVFPLAPPLPNVFERRHHLKKQKCEAIRFRISEEPTAGSAGVGLSGLTLDVGVKRGLGKRRTL